MSRLRWDRPLSATDQPSSASGSASGGSNAPGSGGDYDPESIPIRTAATVLVLDERPDLQVLMLKRNARSIFVGDMWVFPGGAVDPEDASAEADKAVGGLTDVEASAAMDLESGGIAYWAAVLRETFEEAGLLMARPPGSADLIDLSPKDVAAKFEALRDGVNDGSVDFIDMVRSEGLQLDGSGVHYVSRWVTPLGPPRRYDARFFVTAMPAGQVPLHDNDEAVHHEWVSPAEAIRLNETDEMVMMTPTITMLHRLAEFSSVDEAMASARAATSAEDELIRIRFGVEGPHRIAFPVDDDYADSDQRVENGMVRWPAPKR
ncbi:MAG: 8-oxo-dGTP pyrophosphatase MutT (NUDIX family) [Candidatus Poriferisodalaceae bacterium]|jgi:8-oxo-dGTP pyrophosphatase MutT (NUDIX family)